MTELTRPSLDTRTRLSEEALALFLTQGFAATSVRQIADAGGVTIPAIYYHFGSKDGLLGALVEDFIADGERVIAELTSTSRDPVHALACYYDVVTRHLKVFRLVVADPSVRSHDVAGHRLADQGNRFLRLLTRGSSHRNDLVRAHAALGAIRRPLRTEDVDIVVDREQILACALGALEAQI